MTRAELQRTPERPWLKSDENARIVGFCRFRDYYGGYLVYEFEGIKYKQFIGNSTARKMGVRTVNLYGQSGDQSGGPADSNPQNPETQKYTFPTQDDLRREIKSAILSAPMMRKIFRRHPA